jgi:hypothetical protein
MLYTCYEFSADCAIAWRRAELPELAAAAWVLEDPGFRQARWESADRSSVVMSRHLLANATHTRIVKRTWHRYRQGCDEEVIGEGRPLGRNPAYSRAGGHSRAAVSLRASKALRAGDVADFTPATLLLERATEAQRRVAEFRHTMTRGEWRIARFHVLR